jgi:quinol monooxygenase YgiN
MSPFCLLVRFKVRAGQVEDFDRLMTATVAQIAEREPGTVVYVSHSTNEPDVRVFFEAYRTRAAFDAHCKQPHIESFMAERSALVESFTVEELTPLSAQVEGAWRYESR